MLEGKQPWLERRIQRRFQKVIWMPSEDGIHGFEKNKVLCRQVLPGSDILERRPAAEMRRRLNINTCQPDHK